MKFADRVTRRELARMGIHVRNTAQPVGTLSGGERQSIAIARAVYFGAKVLILDEPTSALDIKYQMEILNILKRLNEEENKSLMLAMHDLHLASKFCKRLVLLKQGRVFCEGSPAEVLKKEILEEVYEVKVKIFNDDEDGSLLVVPVAS